MKIAIFEAERWEQDAFESLESRHDLSFFEEPLSAERAEANRDAEILSTFIYSDLSQETLREFENLKLIATRSTGFDHIDTGYCEERGIKVANVPSYGDNTVAEHVFALLLAISHHLVEAADRTRRGDFSLAGLRGFDLQGKTFGVIGTGSIGQHAIKIAKGFGMNVVAHDPKPDDDAARKLGFDYQGLSGVLSQADVVTLHVPGTKATHHLVSRDEFDEMKDGVVLINTARGTVVDTEALIRALADGKVLAAGLDVLPEEPVIREEAELLRSVFTKEHDTEQLLANHVLLRLRNVVITPHSGFNTCEAVQRILSTTRENIEAFTGEEPKNLVT